MGDLEQSIGNRLAALRGSTDRVINLAEVNTILAEVGPVETGSVAPDPMKGLPRNRRRLYRIQEGQDFFGVCQGLAAYSDIPVDWVRTIFFMLALVTGGFFGLVYIAMAFLLPVVATREEYFALHRPLLEVP
jgi:phage shock protein PspC (stress-responsive transcriptional regulator)